MKRTVMSSLMLAAVILAFSGFGSEARAAGEGQPSDWNRFYYYPYVYYPHNFQAPVEYNHMYHRYPQQRQIPVYNKDWHNFYPSPRPYHMGHHFVLDVF
jgi:hypothetical protein